MLQPIDKATETDRAVYYDENYVQMLKKSYDEMIADKDATIAQQRVQIIKLQKDNDKLKAELIKEREKLAVEKGWKKYF